MDPVEVDAPGSQTGILSLEPKSVKPYATKDEYLYAMKEDLAEWFNTLYGLEVTVDNFFEQLETGVVMCQHANNVQSFIAERIAQTGPQTPANRSRRSSFNLPDKPVQYRTKVSPGSFQCRDNVSNFITWCRAIGIKEVVLFETDDLVLKKNERSVVLGLLEVARRGAQYGMLAPTLVQMEVEIDAEIAGHEPPPRPRKMCDLRSLDDRVREMVSRCTCPDQFPMYKVSDGKYRIGDSQTLIFVRILRNHVMVRIGGGWDTLENYLDRHDPCRCAARGHRGRTAGMTSQTQVRRGSAPAQSLVGLELRTRTVTPSVETESFQTPSKQTQRSKRSQNPVSHQTPHTSSKCPAATNQVNRSLDFNQGTNKRVVSPGPEANRRTAAVSTSRDSGISRREMNDTASETSSSCGGSPGLHKRCNSATDLTFPKEMTLTNGSSKLPRQRPTSARDRIRRSTVTSGVPCQNQEATGRGRQNEKLDSALIPGRHNRSRSVEPSDLNPDRFTRSSQGGSKSNRKESNDLLIVSRDDTGKHRVGPTIKQNGNNNYCPTPSSRHSSTSSNGNGQPNGNNSSNGDEFKRPGTPRVNISPDRILPDRPKIMSRSHTADLAHVGESNVDDDLSRPQSRMCMSVPSNQSSTLSLASSYDDLLEAPPEDERLNAEMELQFEEYRKMEQQTRNKNDRHRHGRHTRSNSADFFDLDTTSAERQRLQKAFQKGQGSNRDTNVKHSRSRSRRSSITSIESATSSARQSTSSTPRRTITPTPTRTSSLRGALGMARELRNKINDNVNDKRPANRSSSMNTHTSRRQEDISRKNTSTTPRTRSRSRDNVLDDFRSQPTRGRSQSRDTTIDSSFRSKTKSSNPNSRTQSRDNSMTRVRPGSALGHSSSSAITTSTPNRPSSARGPRSRSRDNLLDDPPAPAPRYQRQRSHSTTAIFSDSKSPDRYSSSPDRDLSRTDYLIELDLDTGTAYKATPRKDDRGGRTRIPMPVDMIQQQKMLDYGNFPPLRRFDSGVDINNMSPTESSIQGEEAWQQELLLQSQQEATALSNQPLTYPVTDGQTKPASSYQDMF